MKKLFQVSMMYIIHNATRAFTLLRNVKPLNKIIHFHQSCKDNLYISDLITSNEELSVIHRYLEIVSNNMLGSYLWQSLTMITIMEDI